MRDIRGTNVGHMGMDLADGGMVLASERKAWGGSGPPGHQLYMQDKAGAKPCYLFRRRKEAPVPKDLSLAQESILPAFPGEGGGYTVMNSFLAGIFKRQDFRLAIGPGQAGSLQLFFPG